MVDEGQILTNFFLFAQGGAQPRRTNVSMGKKSE